MYKECHGHKGEVLDSIDKYDVILCDNCQFTHKIPLPKQGEWDLFYYDSFYDWEDKSNYLEGTEKDRVYRDILHEDKYLNLIEIFGDNTAHSILDIGSGSGLFIEYFKKKGWEAIGVEPSKKAADYALKKNRPTINITIENYIRQNNKKYDVVHIREVLDNILDPLQLIKDISNKLLKNGGICVVDTSNEYNPLQIAIQKLYNIEKWWLKGDTINFFNFDSLQIIFKKSGLSTCHYESTFPLEMFPLMGKNYIGNTDIGKESHLSRVTFEDNLRKVGMWHTKRRLFKVFADNHFGRNIIIYGRKENN